MLRTVGTTARGLRAPVVKNGDDLVSIAVDSIVNAVKQDNIQLHDRDVVCITESLLARSQGNYCTIDSITEDLNRKFGDTIGVLFPITSRNRFSIIMKAIANTKKKIVVFLSYPSDEVGNAIMDRNLLLEHNINIYQDTLSEKQYRELVGENSTHHFTGVDYIQLYKNFAINDNIEIYLSNNPKDILNYTDEVLIANIHDRDYLKAILKKSNAKTVYSMADIMSESIDGSGYNPDYGLYGSNLSDENTVKLFPRNAQDFVESVQSKLNEITGKNLEVMVYGDGAFKDPVGKIWELADPVVSPGFTKGLLGTPNEIKFKYVADTDLKNLSGDEAIAAMKDRIIKKGDNLVGQDDSLGTTPRRITDLLGSLADLISGSGDKGTPIVLIQGYFDNYAND